MGVDGAKRRKVIGVRAQSSRQPRDSVLVPVAASALLSGRALRRQRWLDRVSAFRGAIEQVWCADVSVAGPMPASSA